MNENCDFEQEFRITELNPVAYGPKITIPGQKSKTLARKSLFLSGKAKSHTGNRFSRVGKQNPAQEIAFSVRKKQNAAQEIAFPVWEKQNPTQEIAFPVREKQNAAQEIAFPV